MNYCSYVNKLGFDSFDRSGETYCCNSSENNNLTTIKSFAAQEGTAKLDTDGVIYHGQSLTNALDNLKSSMTSLQSRLTDVFSHASILNNRLNEFDVRLNSFKKNDCEKEDKKSVWRIDRSMFKTLKYGGK